MSDEQEYQDYQDYLEYQKHIANQPAQQPSFMEKLQANMIPAEDAANLANPQALKAHLADIQQHPEHMTERERMSFEAGQGGIAQGAGEGLASIFRGIGKGASRVGDILMQKAAGIPKLIPGVGNTLAEEGIVGTRGMMQNQVEKGLSSRGKEIGELAHSLQDVSTQPVAEVVGSRASKLVGPQGEILPDNIKAFHKYVDEATAASNEGSISGEQAAFRRKGYGEIARKAGAYKDVSPSQTAKAELAGTQQAGYSQALKDAYAAAHPEAPEALAQADQAYSALSRASSSLNKPSAPTLMELLSRSAPATLSESLGGQAASKIGSGLNAPITQSALRQAPVTLEEFLRRNQSLEDR